MIATEMLRDRLREGKWDARLASLYGQAQPAKERIQAVLRRWEETFDRTDCAGVFSAPGRTELGGNHTDHQHGRVLAASVNVDMLAVAAPTGTNRIRVCSEGYPALEISLDGTAPVESERNTSAALIRGVACRIRELGYTVGGFDVYMVSDVPAGSGLSSSAAYEVLLGTIMNHLFCGAEISAVRIAQIGQYAENVFFGKPCGLMDQTACAVGGAVAIDFADPAAPVVEGIGVDLTREGYALCILESGANHADLTEEYAAIPAEMRAVAAAIGHEVLREVEEDAFFDAIPRIRARVGDRAVLRAIHFFAENRRAADEAEALRQDDFPRFLALMRESGQSSYMYLQNVSCHMTPREQAVAVALAVTERALAGEGAFRVHGGGFAGTIQAIVPLARLEDFRRRTEAVLGAGKCHAMSIRPEGGVQLLTM
ncbi:MAG: galactokinase [Clostridia bacterium]|nr:galactokinase [Clostridia bacterium]